MRTDDPLIFISYRRRDSSAIARWLAETIQTAFGSSSVFIDTDAIRIGDDWPSRITGALSVATVLVSVIGPHWLRFTDDFGRRRLDMTDDWVRGEILHAINNKILLIPLLVNGAILPVKEALPDCLVPLLNYHAFELRDDHWDSDRNLLLTRLEEEGFGRTGSPLPSNTGNGLACNQELVFQQQVSVLKTALALLYRARNAARSTNGSANDDRQRSDGLQKLRTYQEAVDNMLFEERALLPHSLFYVLHNMKRDLLDFCCLIERYSRMKANEGADTNSLLEDIDHAYQSLDGGYERLVSTVQAFIGISAEG